MANWNKYHAKKTTIRGQTFDSKKEAARYQELRLLQIAGEITDLRRQVPFLLIPAQYIDGKCVERGVTYKADFVYRKDGELVVEDAKGVRTSEYKIKRKLMLERHGIMVKET